MFGFTASVCRSCASSCAVSSYQGLFCGVSCNMSAYYGALSRFLINRDSTVLSLVGHGIQEESPTVTHRTCCNPFSQPKPLMQESAVSEYTGAVTVCALAAKLQDDQSDETGGRQLAARLLGSSIGRARDRAVAVLNSTGFPTQRVMDALERQDEIESGQPNVIEAAAPTAMAYGSIFHHLGVITGNAQVELAKFGQALGNLIYWRDAIDDQESDVQSGKFNLLQYTPVGELTQAASVSMAQLQTSAHALQMYRYQDLLAEVVTATQSKHQDMLGFAQQKPKERKKSFLSRECDYCSPCELLECLSCGSKGGGSDDCAVCCCEGCSCGS